VRSYHTTRPSERSKNRSRGVSDSENDLEETPSRCNSQRAIEITTCEAEEHRGDQKRLVEYGGEGRDKTDEVESFDVNLKKRGYY